MFNTFQLARLQNWPCEALCRQLARAENALLKQAANEPELCVPHGPNYC